MNGQVPRLLMIRMCKIGYFNIAEIVMGGKSWEQDR